MRKIMDAQSLNIHDKLQKRRNIAENMPFLPPLAAVAMRLLHRTCRIEIVGKEHYLAAEEIKPRIAAFWHFTYPSILYFYRDQGYLTIISRSRDGEFAARLVKRLGYNPFRGSPGKGGAAASGDVLRLSHYACQRCCGQELAVSNLGQDASPKAFCQGSLLLGAYDPGRAGGFIG